MGLLKNPGSAPGKAVNYVYYLRHKSMWNWKSEERGLLVEDFGIEIIWRLEIFTPYLGPKKMIKIKKALQENKIYMDDKQGLMHSKTERG